MDSHISSIDEQIRLHADQDKNQGLITHAVSLIWDGGSSQSLRSLEQLKAQAGTQGNAQPAEQMRERIETAVAEDRQNTERRDTYLGYATGALETAFMALSGTKVRTAIGLAGTIGTYALDSMKSGKNWNDRIKDAALGVTKGLALRATFQGTRAWNPIAQGMLTGLEGRFAEYASNRELYQDTSLKGISSGLAQAAKLSLDSHTLRIDGATLGAGALSFSLLEEALGGRLAKATMTRAMLGAGSYGFASGVSNEMLREQANHEDFNLSKVVTRGGTQAILNSLAVAPGAIHFRAPEKPVEHDAGTVNDDAPKQPREFKVVGKRDELDAFIAYARGKAHNPKAAILQVESVGDSTATPKPRPLLLQHTEARPDVLRADNFARLFPNGLVASCNPAMLTRIARDLHVLPQAERVQLSMREADDGTHIALTAGDTIPDGYDHLTQLGERGGLIRQRELLQWVLRPVDASEATTPVGKLRGEVQAELKNGWKLALAATESIADQVGQDYVLYHQDGRYFFYDSTLDASSKIPVSQLRKDAVIQINMTKDDIPTITVGTKFAFLEKLLSSMRSDESVLNWKETGRPDYTHFADNQQAAQGISAYRSGLNGFVGRLKALASAEKDSAFRQALETRAALIENYSKDAARAEKQAGIRSAAEHDPQAHARKATIWKHIESTAQDEVIKLLTNQTNRDYIPIADVHPNRMSADMNYDKLMLRYTFHTYPIEGVGAKVHEVMNQAIASLPKIDMELKRWMLSEGGMRTIRNRVINRLGQMEAGELTGQPPEPKTNPAGKERAKERPAPIAKPEKPDMDPVFDKLHKGDTVTGFVANKADYGLFVAISPTFNALLHKSDLHGVSLDQFKRGDPIHVIMGDMNRLRQRVNVSIDRDFHS